MSGSGDDTIDPRDGDLLAAEFVLGVLPSAEQAVLARRREHDPAFGREVSAWEDRLLPLAADYVSEAPRPAVKHSLDLQLFGQPQPNAATGLWSRLTQWRLGAFAGLAGAGVGVLAGLALALWLPMQTPGAPDGGADGRLAASLSAEGSTLSYLAVYDAGHSQLSLTPLAGEAVAGRDFELWIARGSEAPLSLGVIPAAQPVRLDIAPAHQALMSTAAHIAISLEPIGGSPTGQPTGPILAVGDLLEI